MIRRLYLLTLLLFSLPVTALADVSRPAWDPTVLSVPVVVDEQTIPYPEFALYVLPGQPLEVSVPGSAQAIVHFQGERRTAQSATLTAPAEPGLSRLEIENPAAGETAVINVFTLVPSSAADGKGFLGRYRIGRYPERPLKGLPIYRPPPGYVEVTPANAQVRLSPNFRLGQFVSKQEQGHPKYVVLRSNLLLKLEAILAALNSSGHPTGSLVIMSGYRTPWYNQRIGNVPYSRHVWGGAADIYIDESPADGVMDDLNGDGKVDRGDAEWLAAFVDDMSRRGEFGPNIGGIGVYDSNAAHGPFIHVDARGIDARW